MLGHDLEKDLAFDTKQRDNAKLLNVARVLLRDPDSLSIPPLRSDFPSPPNHLQDHLETFEEL